MSRRSTRRARRAFFGLHDELAEDCRGVIYADTAAEIEKRRKAFQRKQQPKCRITGLGPS